MRRASDACRLVVKSAQTSGRATSTASASSSAPLYRVCGSSAGPFRQNARSFSNATSGTSSSAGGNHELHDIAASFAAVPLSMIPTQIGVAAGVATFWRGAWYVMDGLVFPEDVVKSSVASFGIGVGGVVGIQRIAAPAVLSHYTKNKTPIPQGVRYALLYGMGLSCVAVWKGTWLAWDVGHEFFGKDKATDTQIVPGIYSHLTAVVGLVASGYLSSMLAPPAVCLLLTDEALKGKNQFLKGATWLVTRVKR